MNMNICKICNKEFPVWVEINGKKRNLKNRKYCLDCSPFGNHNTKQLHIKETERERKVLTEEQKRKVIERIKRWRRKTKQRSIDYLGGECIKCGYKKCNAALVFHHKDPTQKDFGISSGDTRSWERIKEELDKCILLCANCHAEVHADMKAC